jgi:carboxyl-terminal processing protease
VDVRIVEQRIVIHAIINDSPADLAGIEVGDLVISIDGKPIKGRPLQNAAEELRGAPGTEVRVTMLREGEGERDLTITREYIDLPTLNFRLLDEHYGYFSMSYFHRDSATDLQNSLDAIKADGLVLRGLILDLRNNPGGVLQPAVAMADGFLEDGLIVSTRGRNDVMQLEFNAKPGEWLPGVPLVILVDRGTASASEVLAGALQDHGRALIVGEKTFGKGSVQSILPLQNGGGIKLTTARYYTPSGRSIQAHGIVPDVVVRPVEFVNREDQRRREADLERHLDNDGTEPVSAPRSVSPEEDYPLHEALSLLKGARILSGGGRQLPELHAGREQ